MEKLDDLMRQQNEARNKQKMLMLMGGLAKNLTNNQSAGNYFLGRMNQAPDNSAFEKAAQMVGDPMKDEARKMAMMDAGRKRERDQLMAQREDKSFERSQAMMDPNSELSKSYLDAFEKAMPGVGKQLAGMSTEQMKQMLPLIAGARDKAADRQFKLELQRLKNQKKTGTDKTFQFSPEERKYWKSRGVTDEQINMAEAGRAGRNPLGALNAIAEKDEIGATDLKTIKDFQQSRIALEKIGDDFFGDKDLVGWWDGNIPQMMSSAKVNEFRSRIGKFNDLYRKAITGTGASEKEIANLMANLPKANDSEEAFLGKLRSSMNDLVDQQNQYLDLLDQSGQFVGNIERMAPYDFGEGKKKQTAGNPLANPKAKAAPQGPKKGDTKTHPTLGIEIVFDGKNWVEK